VHWLARIFDFFASLRLAVIIVISLAVVAAVGTIFEARYDAQVAQKLVYKSIYMYVVMGLLVTNLIAVMVDRWPWKRHHTGFVLAHIGIITLLAGSLITQKLGVDGSMAFTIGDSNRYVTVDEVELGVYSSTLESGPVPVFPAKPVDFFLEPPSEEKPYRLQIGNDRLEVVEYVHYGIRQSEILPGDKPTHGPAMRLQLQSSRVNMTQWVIREPGAKKAEISLGPARVIMADTEPELVSGNAIVLIPGEKDWKYSIYTARKGGLDKKGTLNEGSVIPTGWMDIELRVLRIYPRAQEVVKVARREQPTSITRPAIRLRFNGDEQWLMLNSVLKLFAADKMYWISFANRRLDVGFEMALNKFNMGKYPGTNRAASYESEVEVPGLGSHVISMNEPLKHNGFTFYQASFEQNEMGRPTTSILSVNRDPGRWIKYLGSLIMVLGTIMLFYFRRPPAGGASRRGVPASAGAATRQS
jgi:hypothetical protein